MIATPTIVPNQHETEENFIVRAHQELMLSHPDPSHRNQVVWDAWENHSGHPERYRAEQNFPAEKYSHVRDVCVWHEHESPTIDKDGKPSVRVNDVNRLAAIVRENNFRIRDTDAYSAISDKHTLGANDSDIQQAKPKVIGFTGPYRLGMVGREQPRFAIFGDEHRRNDQLSTFESLPRRSVEVVTLRSNGRSYLDPIAALGGDSPRLPLPVQYSVNSEREQFDIERYSGVDALPGGSNTFIPQFGSNNSKEKFGAFPGDDQSDQQQPPSGTEDPNMVRQFIDALGQTPEWKFIQQLMQTQGGAPQQQPPQGAPAQYMGGAAMQYSAASQNGGHGNHAARTEPIERQEPSGIESEKYQALVDSNAQMMEQMAAIQSQNVQLAANAADAHRTQVLTGLADEHPTVDLDKELSRCLYSAGSQMNEQGFDDHVEMIREYTPRGPVNSPMIPQGELPGHGNQIADPVEREKYGAAIGARSVEIYNARSAAGEYPTPDQCWREAEKEIQEAV